MLSIAMAFGFGIAVLAYTFGHISGGHINPAVTSAFMFLEEISPMKGLLYMVAQMSGAFIGALLLWACTSGLTADCTAVDGVTLSGTCQASSDGDGDFAPPYFLAVNQLSDNTTIYGGFLLEVIGTFLLVITVLLTAVDPNSSAGNLAPAAIGWSVMLCHIVMIPFTNCGINPARSFGPMIVDLIAGVDPSFRGWWCYYTAPFVGALLAAISYKFIFEAPVEAEESQDKKEDPAAAEVSA